MPVLTEPALAPARTPVAPAPPAATAAAQKVPFAPAAVAIVLALAALLATIGADAQWLAALGHVIVDRGAVPRGIPFAAAPTGHWPNALVLAEVLFHLLQSAFGDRGLMAAQLAAVAVAAWVLIRDAEAGGATPAASAGAATLAAIGAIPSLAIVRVQLFSILLFPVLLALIRSDARRPGPRLWLAVPLLALWSNLHGAALLGAGVLLAYLALSRLRRAEGRLSSLALAGASVLALGLTPALWRTPAYYHGVLTNLAAQRGEGMWAPLSISAPLDVLLALATVFLLARSLRLRPALWECGVVLVLAVLTLKADRDGVWLLFFLVGPAARGLRPKRTWTGLMPLAVVAGVAVVALALARGPQPSGAGRTVVERAVALAHGSPVLADGSIDEQIALAGGRIWVGNPIDAFARTDQAAYLDWLDGRAAGRRALAPDVRVVVVTRRGADAALMRSTPGFIPAGGDAATAIYVRTG